MTQLKHPALPTALRLIALLIAVLSPATAVSQIYSCPAADGSITYRQTPCPEPASAESKTTADVELGDPTNADCEAAGRLAFATARLMQGGLDSAATIDQFGGTALPASARQLIDSVYSFRDDAELSAERIGALGETICRGGSFGELNCETLPAGSVRVAAGCGGASTAAIPARRPAVPDTGTSNLTAAERQEIRTCREPIEAEIEAIDVELRRGVTGEAAQRRLKELLSLTDALRACAR